MTEPVIRTDTDHVVLYGENLPNHSTSLAGRGRYVRISPQTATTTVPIFRTRQEAYRLAANLLCTAQELPNEDNAHTWDEILEAVLSQREVEMDEFDDGLEGI